MRRTVISIARTLLGGLATAQLAFGQGSFTVVPFEFDPFGTHLVAAEWKGGIGCPTNATFTPDGVNFFPFSDPACLSGDPSDKRNEGLLLAKTGPTSNFAAAGAVIKGVQ